MRLDRQGALTPPTPTPSHNNNDTKHQNQITKAFKALDRDGSGTICADELADAMKRLGVAGDDAAKLLESADTNQVWWG
jgi:Ca2+-binding EF-hand superfamily protein